MKIGVPKGLLYPDYHLIVNTFFAEMGAEVVNSPDTNREILDLGVQYCVDEACLPMKVFHGHVSWLRGRCDAIFVPRIMSLREKEYICPKFCGLTEMLANSIPGLPRLIGEPIYWTCEESMREWARKAGSILTRDRNRVMRAIDIAIKCHAGQSKGLNQKGYGIKVALLGHPYNIRDAFLNMDLIKKLNQLGVGVITQEAVPDSHIEEEVKRLFKKPFWTFARNTYGAVIHMCRSGMIDGIVYVSSFACGIDSVVIDMIRLGLADVCPDPENEDFPFLVLKLDEHTGEAGLNTRIEAFADLFGRRMRRDGHHTAFG